jgi:hypothetical protein
VTLLDLGDACCSLAASNLDDADAAVRATCAQVLVRAPGDRWRAVLLSRASELLADTVAAIHVGDGLATSVADAVYPAFR